MLARTTRRRSWLTFAFSVSAGLILAAGFVHAELATIARLAVAFAAAALGAMLLIAIIWGQEQVHDTLFRTTATLGLAIGAAHFGWFLLHHLDHLTSRPAAYLAACLAGQSVLVLGAQ